MNLIEIFGVSLKIKKCKKIFFLKIIKILNYWKNLNLVSFFCFWENLKKLFFFEHEYYKLCNKKYWENIKLL